MGFFDIEDFMSYLFNLLVQEKDVDLVCTFRKQKIEVLAHKGRMPPAWVPVCERDSLYRLCQIFSTGVHRVPVTNLKGNLIGVVSQTDIIRILLQHPRLLPGDMANKLVGELDTIRKPDFILGVNDHSKAWVAMYKMLRRDLTSVPVLDEDGKLVTALTINHLKGLRSGDFHLLLSTVPKFIQKISPAGWTQVEKCLPSAPFSEVLQKLYDHSTHRVWVVEQDDKLVGLLTLTDILKYVVTIHS
jgi:5'-AMP-activated protein kinase regulatory gamma subunit